ncbi:MAG: NUDIX domain-containing protein, partial [archaeon]
MTKKEILNTESKPSEVKLNLEQEKIIQKLMHSKGLRFKDLKDKIPQSNKLSYHLNTLQDFNLITKDKEKYKLTIQGKSLCSYLDGSTGKSEKQPVIGVFVIIIDKDKILVQKRLKEPYFGIYGMTGGKLRFEQSIFECAKKELKEETGLSCNLEFKGISTGRTFDIDSKNQIANYIAFVLKGTNPKGKLIKKTREGENKWFKISDIKKIKNIFPESLDNINIILNNN